MDQLDTLDSRILFELDGNSRQSLSQLARSLGQGRDRIEYRLERLFERKIISKCTASVNIQRLGYSIYKAYFRLENDKQRLAACVEFLRQHPRVFWVARCDGSWDLMCTIFSKSPVEYHSILTEFVSSFNDIVLDFSVATLVEVHMYRKGYFTGEGGDYVLLGGAHPVGDLDFLDYQLLAVLAENARLSSTEIAKTLSTTTAVVKHRIRRLEKQQIIIGYSIEVDLQRLNLLYFKAQLFLRNHSVGMQDLLLRYCHENPYVSQFIRQLGDCVLELEITAPDYATYHSILGDIRERFAKLIRNYNTVMIQSSHRDWVPRDMLKSVN